MYFRSYYESHCSHGETVICFRGRYIPKSVETTMSEPTLTEVFGASASQDSTTLTITKSDLTAVGLTPSSSNSAESLFIALLLKAIPALNEINRAVDPALRNITILYVGQDLTLSGTDNYRRDAWQVNAYKPTPLATIDPDDY